MPACLVIQLSFVVERVIIDERFSCVYGRKPNLEVVEGHVPEFGVFPGAVLKTTGSAWAHQRLLDFGV